MNNKGTLPSILSLMPIRQEISWFKKAIDHYL
ncbi:MAG: hypothetical protein K0R69_2403 [Clostridia bacterium]|jgi:hypothetical protein|nr:hypothetical protein [Clostridia bacterium]